MGWNGLFQIWEHVEALTVTPNSSCPHKQCQWQGILSFPTKHGHLTRPLWFYFLRPGLHQLGAVTEGGKQRPWRGEKKKQGGKRRDACFKGLGDNQGDATTWSGTSQSFSFFKKKRHQSGMKAHDCNLRDVMWISSSMPARGFWDCLKSKMKRRAPLAHTHNPSYSGDRDQEDRGSNPAQANSLQDPIMKNLLLVLMEALSSRWRPWVQAPVLQKKKKKQNENKRAEGVVHVVELWPSKGQALVSITDRAEINKWINK
jgi:hypothetical protein